ncbi:hypothetical protein FQR65_LT05979 [Abscondita terminalis]|nr:hypothetical protein FQR65_LT05979 [Abscondita terminalis]
MVKLVNYGLVATCLIGLSLSFYSYRIERAVEHDKDYVASCDFSENFSCSKAFKSKFGKGFGMIGNILGEDSALNQPNSLFGILIYSFLATIVLSDSRLVTKVALSIILLSNVASVYFGYILIFILHDFCIVCVCIYVVNFVNLLLILKKINNIDADKPKKH